MLSGLLRAGETDVAMTDLALIGHLFFPTPGSIFEFYKEYLIN